MWTVHRAVNLTTFMCGLSWNLGSSASWNPQGLSRPVMGLLYLYVVLQWQRRFEKGDTSDFRTYPVCITVCEQAILSEIFIVLRLLNFEIIHWNRLRSYMLPDSLFTPILPCYFPVLLASWTVDASCVRMSPMKQSAVYATLLSSLSLIVNRNYSA